MTKIKSTPIYGLYKESVERGGGNEPQNKFLQMTTMMFALADKELSMIMTSVAYDLLFAMVDQRLRNEILGTEE